MPKRRCGWGRRQEVRRLQRERLERQMAGQTERAVIGEDLGESAESSEPR